MKRNAWQLKDNLLKCPVAFKNIHVETFSHDSETTTNNHICLRKHTAVSLIIEDRSIMKYYMALWLIETSSFNVEKTLTEAEK